MSLSPTAHTPAASAALGPAATRRFSAMPGTLASPNEKGPAGTKPAARCDCSVRTTLRTADRRLQQGGEHLLANAAAAAIELDTRLLANGKLGRLAVRTPVVPLVRGRSGS